VGSTLKLFTDRFSTREWVSFEESERALQPRDMQVFANFLEVEELGQAVAAYAAWFNHRARQLTVAEERVLQRRAGSKKARITDDDLRLIAQAVRDRTVRQTAARAIMEMPDRRIGRTRAYQLIDRVIAEGYLRSDEV
jgi:hypothetical protein